MLSEEVCLPESETVAQLRDLTKSPEQLVCRHALTRIVQKQQTPKKASKKVRQTTSELPD